MEAISATTRSRFWWWRLAVLGAIVLGGGLLVWMQFVQTYHFAVVDEGVLYRDGMRNLREFTTAVGRAQPKMIVCLVDETEQRKPPFDEEAVFAKRVKAKYKSIAVPLGGWPTSEQVQAFLKLVQKRENQPVLVHCAQGVRRTGMMVAAYQMSVLGWDKARTREAILTFGHSERSIGDIRSFIDRYDPSARTVNLDGLGAATQRGTISGGAYGPEPAR